VWTNQVDDSFEKLQLFFRRPDSTPDNDALPWPSVQCNGHPSLDIVAAVETDQAGFRMEAAVTKSRHADIDRVGDRLRVPWTGHTIGVETDNEDIQVRECITH
jgi:hypothetical protein